MKPLKRMIALLLCVCLMAGVCSVSSYAAGGFPFFPGPGSGPVFRPGWTEMNVSIESGDNTLRGYLTAPSEIEGKLPVAILLHGLASDNTACQSAAYALAENGIASVRFDFSGFGKSDGVQEEMTVSGQVTDTIAILDYVQSLDFTDPDNIFMVGKSMGGVDATLAAYQRQDEIKAMCLYYPGFSVLENTRHGYLLGEFFKPWDPPETLTVDGTRYKVPTYTYGREFILDAQELDYWTACTTYDNPVLILHGTRDFIVPLFSSFAVEKLFPDSQLEVVPGGGHGFWGFQELHTLNRMVEFIKGNIS